MVPFVTDKATGGLGARNGGRGFGVELEFDIDPGVKRADALAAIARDLHTEGILAEARQRSYHSSSDYSRWRFETDATMDGEIISPVLNDEPRAWEQLAKVCEARRHRGRGSAPAGGHVHVGVGDFDHTVEAPRLDRGRPTAQTSAYGQGSSGVSSQDLKLDTPDTGRGPRPSRGSSGGQTPLKREVPASWRPLTSSAPWAISRTGPACQVFLLLHSQASRQRDQHEACWASRRAGCGPRLNAIVRVTGWTRDHLVDAAADERTGQRAETHSVDRPDRTLKQFTRREHFEPPRIS